MKLFDFLVEHVRPLRPLSAHVISWNGDSFESRLSLPVVPELTTCCCFNSELIYSNRLECPSVFKKVRFSTDRKKGATLEVRTPSRVDFEEHLHQLLKIVPLAEPFVRQAALKEELQRHHNLLESARRVLLDISELRRGL